MLVGQAVESVAHELVVAQRAGEREQLGEGRLGAVERRVEVSDLGQARPSRRHRSDRGEVVGLVGARHSSVSPFAA
ncbi:hypothetical protein ASF53_11150 [Methylobacterium sp. Leaf123]|nr:hypothetical protein ASF53_11150 [Methylobacterium sp. Leaf123]